MTIIETVTSGQSRTYSGLNVGGTLVVGAGQHRDDTDQDGLDGVDWRPTLARLLITVFVLAGRVLLTHQQDR